MRALINRLPPLLQRDLLGSSRKAWTYWLRFLTTLAAVGVVLVIALGHRDGLGQNEGRLLFRPLVMTLLVIVSVTGLRSTSDCVNRERREGTLGLLFLTDLKLSTILISKLISHSIQNVAALLAVLPVLGICVLLGGVSGYMLLQGMLAVLAALALSLTVGLHESCTRDDDHLAFGHGLRALLLYNLLPFVSPISLLLPSAYGPYGPGAYFWATLIFILLLVCLHWSNAKKELKRNWRHAPRLERTNPSSASITPPVGHLPRTPRLCGNNDPAMWIISRYGDFRQASPRAIATAFLVCIFIVALLAGAQIDDPQFMLGLYLVVMGGARFVQMLAMAKIAPQSFAEITGHGALEILQTTPVTLRELVSAARSFLVREFGRGVLPMLAFDLGVAVLIGLHGLAPHNESSTALVVLFLQNLVFLTALPAIGLFGVFAGLRFGSFSRAAFWTALLMVILPLLAFLLGNYRSVAILLGCFYTLAAVLIRRQILVLITQQDRLIRALYH